MKEKLQRRLQNLKSEFEEGQKILAELEAKQASLRETLLRISGAIQVLEEVLSEVSEENGSLSDIPDSGSGAIAPLQEPNVLKL
jgi:predicted nuclease with TOPRIM domain